LERSRTVLPLLTTLLPVIAGAGWLHGAMAGVLAVGSLFVVDFVQWVLGELRYETTSPRPEAPRGLYGVLFYVYAAGFLVFFTRFALTSGRLPLAEAMGQVFSWVLLAGVPTLIVGHAFIHAPGKTARVVGQLLFSAMNYPDFPMHHVETHHRHVATDLDPHSAPANVDFFRFFVRCFAGETRGLASRKRRTRVVVLTILQAAILASVATVGGARAFALYLLTTFLARMVVALVNYVQHYGLRRAAGQKTSEHHSWDLPHRSASWLYFNAGFHAEHHAKASTPPEDLAFHGPHYVLPYNIPIILSLALVPAWFFRTMNPILEGEGAGNGRTMVDARGVPRLSWEGPSSAVRARTSRTRAA
jgi:alkane 1-monooxygenase